MARFVSCNVLPSLDKKYPVHEKWLVGQNALTGGKTEVVAADYLLQPVSPWLFFKVLPDSLLQ